MAQLTEEQRAQYTQQMRTLMGEVQRLQAEGKKDDPLTQRYVEGIKKLGGLLKRPDTMPEWMSAGMGLTQAPLGLGDEIGAAIEAAFLPQSVMHPLYRMMGEKVDEIIENPFEELSPLHQAYGALTADDDEPTARETYQQYREEMFPGGPSALEEMPFMERYAALRDRTRNMLKTAREEDPFAAFGGELVGAAGFGGGGLTRFGIQKGATTMQNIPRLMGVGSLEGAGYGYGTAEGDPIAASLGEPGKDVMGELEKVRDPMIMGTGLGGLSAGLIPATGAGVRAGMQRMIPYNRRVEEAARRPIAEAYEFDVERGVTDPATTQKMLDVPEMTIADVGRQVRNVATEVAGTPTRAAETLRKFYEERNLGTAGRLRDQLTDALRIETDDLASATFSFMNDIGKRADEAYKLAYQKPIQMSNNMRQLLQTPFGQQAMRKAKVARMNRGKNPDALNLTGAMQSTRDMDSILRNMNARVKKAFRDGDADADELAAMRDRFERQLYAANDDYRAARQQYASDQDRVRALEYGQKIFSGKKLPDYVRQDISRMSAAEQEIMRLGVLEGAVKQIVGKQKTADTMKGIWNKEGTNEILREVFSDKRIYDQFVDHIDANREMFKTWSQVQRAAERDPLQESRAKGWLARTIEMLGYTGGLQTGTGTARAGGAAGEELGRMITPATVPQIQKDIAERQAEMLMGKDIDRIMQPHTFGGILSPEAPKLGGTVPAGAVPGVGPAQGEEYGYPESRGIFQ